MEAMTEKGFRISRFAELFSLEILNKGCDYDNALLTVVDVNRPGLQFQGFFDYFDPQRLQVIGKAEFEFLRMMEPKERKRRLDNLFLYDIPALVIARGLVFSGMSGKCAGA